MTEDNTHNFCSRSLILDPDSNVPPLVILAPHPQTQETLWLGWSGWSCWQSSLRLIRLWLVAVDAALTVPVLRVAIARVHDIVAILIFTPFEEAQDTPAAGAGGRGIGGTDRRVGVDLLPYR